MIGCTGECRLPHDPRLGLICNYLLQCSGRVQFALVQDVDYLVYRDGSAAYMRVHMRAQAHTFTGILPPSFFLFFLGDTDEFPQPST